MGGGAPLKPTWQERSSPQRTGRTDIHMRSLRLLILHASSNNADLQSDYPLSYCPPQRAHSLAPLWFFVRLFSFFLFFWHSCTNKLRFMQVRASAGSRCYRCISAARQTVHSPRTSTPPGRLHNEGVIGLIALCLPILLLK